MGQRINKKKEFTHFNRLGLKFIKKLSNFKLKVTKVVVKKRKNSKVDYYRYVIQQGEDVYYTEPEKEPHLIAQALYLKLEFIYNKLNP
jgi:hypothetical protein